MKTIVKITGLVLALVMLLSVAAACKGGETEPGTVSTPLTAETGETASAAASTPVEKPTESATPEGPKQITGLKLTKSGMELHVGESQQLEYVVTPADADTSGLVWSVQDTSVATVENGLVTAVGLGSTQVFLKTYDGLIKLSCKVEVVEGEIRVIPVQSIKLPKSLLILKKGEQYDFSCTAEPADATDKTLQYRVESAATASIDQTGRVTALEAGLNKIIVTSGKIEATCLLIIKNEDGSLPAALTANKTIQIGKSEDLIPDSAVGGDSLKLVSSDTSVVALSGGTATGMKAGTAVVTASDAAGNELYIFNITVTEKPSNLPVTGIKLDKTTVTVKVGETVKLTATLLPEGAAQRKIEWINESKGEIYTVTQDGEITGVKAGSKYVTVYVAEPTTNKSYTFVCMVNVVAGDTPGPQPGGKITGITVEKDHVTLKVGQTYTIAYTLIPAGNENVKIEFINEAKKYSDYLEIDVNTGTVKALKAFTPTDKQPAITIYIDGSKTESGKSITKCIWITVTE